MTNAGPRPSRHRATRPRRSRRAPRASARDHRRSAPARAGRRSRGRTCRAADTARRARSAVRASAARARARARARRAARDEEAARPHERPHAARGSRESRGQHRRARRARQQLIDVRHAEVEEPDVDHEAAIEQRSRRRVNRCDRRKSERRPRRAPSRGKAHVSCRARAATQTEPTSARSTGDEPRNRSPSAFGNARTMRPTGGCAERGGVRSTRPRSTRIDLRGCARRCSSFLHAPRTAAGTARSAHRRRAAPREPAATGAIAPQIPPPDLPRDVGRDERREVHQVVAAREVLRDERAPAPISGRHRPRASRVDDRSSDGTRRARTASTATTAPAGASSAATGTARTRRAGRRRRPRAALPVSSRTSRYVPSPESTNVERNSRL